jgi:hypothetical protein
MVKDCPSTAGSYVTATMAGTCGAGDGDTNWAFTGCTITTHISMTASVVIAFQLVVLMNFNPPIFMRVPASASAAAAAAAAPE